MFCLIKHTHKQFLIICICFYVEHKLFLISLFLFQNNFLKVSPQRGIESGQLNLNNPNSFTVCTYIMKKQIFCRIVPFLNPIFRTSASALGRQKCCRLTNDVKIEY